MSKFVLPVKRDIIFKIFFADERNIEFLTDFLKSALSIPAEEYDEIIIVDPHLIREHESDKLGVIDVKLKTVMGRTIHIEIEVAPLPHMRARIAYYDAKMIAEQIGKGEKYKDIKQVISIVITEKEFISSNPGYHHRFTMYDSVNKVELTDIVEVHTLELCKIQNATDDSRLRYWMEFIKAEGESELEAVANRDPLIKKAVVRLMELSADEKTRILYEAREKERMDIEDIKDGALATEREKWQSVVADKEAAYSAALADKDVTLAEQAALIAKLKARLSENQSE
jgi:predicted transposase/invertase (TIGR01784 family)